MDLMEEGRGKERRERGSGLGEDGGGKRAGEWRGAG